MNIQLRFFASIREALGTTQETISLPEQVRTVGDVRDFLRQRGAPWSDVLAEGKVLRMACNHHLTDATAPISEGCELAFFPPVTGG